MFYGNSAETRKVEKCQCHRLLLTYSHVNRLPSMHLERSLLKPKRISHNLRMRLQLLQQLFSYLQACAHRANVIKKFLKRSTSLNIWPLAASFVRPQNQISCPEAKACHLTSFALLTITGSFKAQRPSLCHHSHHSKLLASINARSCNSICHLMVCILEVKGGFDATPSLQPSSTPADLLKHSLLTSAD